MTCRAVLAWIDVVLRGKRLALFTSHFRPLIPREIGDLRNGSKSVDRVTVALEAPTHGERRMAVDHFHLIHASMALHATHTAVHMRGMIEVAVIGKLVHLDPFDGHSRLVGTTNLRQLGALAVNLRVAVHAGLGGRHGRKGCSLDCRVAVPTVQAELPHMERMAVRHWLRRHIARVNRLWAEPIRNNQHGIQGHDCARDEDEGQDRVRPAGKEESAHGGLVREAVGAAFSRAGLGGEKRVDHFVIFFTMLCRDQC